MKRLQLSTLTLDADLQTTPFAGCSGTARFRIGQISDAGVDGGIGGQNCCAGCT